MKVKATKLGYYDLIRRYPGDVFEIKEEKEFSSRWMERLEPKPKHHEAEIEPEVEQPKRKSKKATGDVAVI